MAVGIRPTASGTLMQVVATAVLGVMGKEATENNLGPGELTEWLRSQKDSIGSVLLKDAIETALVQPASPSLAEHARHPTRQPAAAPALHAAAPWSRPTAEPAFAPQARSGLRWEWGALLLLAVCLGYFLGAATLPNNRPRPQPAPRQPPMP
ncbi:hypothetical protein ACFQT0_20965 [Hymenobacter humi]|uniref:DUF937 domain-containing protein n=1 Tax=Hymenobacter humi TaxID=1411620 RepID=A0ABW2U9P0_9BACT